MTVGDLLSRVGPLPGIHVRVCQTHRVELVEAAGDVLWCPTGKHAARKWDVVRSDSGRLVAAADADELEATEPATKEIEMPMPRKDGQPSAPATKALDKITYQDHAGGQLVLRLVSKPKAPRFRVVCRCKPSTGDPFSGVLAYTDNEPDAYAAFSREQEKAERPGWRLPPPRGLDLIELPAPAAAAPPSIQPAKRGGWPKGRKRSAA